MDQDVSSAQATVPAQVRGIAVVMIHVIDLERSVRFYKEVLGFGDAEQMLEPGVTLQAGDLMIYLAAGRSVMQRDDHRSPEISLCMVVRGVRAASDRLREAGVTMVGEYDQTSEQFASVQFEDPDGNLLQIWGPA